MLPAYRHRIGWPVNLVQRSKPAETRHGRPLRDASRVGSIRAGRADTLFLWVANCCGVCATVSGCVADRCGAHAVGAGTWRFGATSVEFRLHHGRARWSRARSTTLVQDNDGRKSHDAITHVQVWPVFEKVIPQAVKPAARGDVPAGCISRTSSSRTASNKELNACMLTSIRARHARGACHSFSSGMIGRAWRLFQSKYDPDLSPRVAALFLA